MYFLSETAWQKLALPDWRSRFFIECYSEALSVKTPHFHQAKMMGVIDLAKEVLDNIQVYEQNDKGKGYLVSSLKELKIVLEKDSIAKFIFSDLIDIFDDCTKNLSAEKIPKSLIIQLSILCKSIVKESNNYFDKLQSELIRVISDDLCLTEKERLTQEINSLTRNYVTFLLNAGYSPTYLFNKSKLLTIPNNYNGRIFKDQLKFLFSTLDCKIREFHIFFAIKTNKKTTLNSYKPFKGVKVLTEIPAKHFTISTKTFALFKPDFYIKISTESLDYISASLQASERIESEIDYLKALVNNVDIKLHKNCYAEYRAKGNTYQTKLNIRLINSLLTYDFRSSKLSGFLNFDFRNCLSYSSNLKLESILKNLRQVKEASRLEQKLLSLWISLESLNYSGDDKSVISSIVSSLPKLYATQSISLRVNYILYIFSKLEISIPSTVKVRHNIIENTFTEKFDINVFFDIVKNTESAKEVCASIHNFDFAYFRFYGLHKLVSNKKTVKERILNTKEGIEHHLYRIYKTRNNIVHVGFAENLNHFSINHLSEYINTLLISLFEIIAHAKHPIEIELDDIFLSTQLVIDNKFKSIEKDPIEKLSDLNFNAII